jgi:hypothetical protein
VSKWLVLALCASATAHANPLVVAYNPPPEIDRAHRGLTLEIAAGAGSTSVDDSAGGVSFAIGGWITHDLALAFRASDIGAYAFAGGSLQYYATPSLWLGAGAGSLGERGMDQYGGTTQASGGGGFVRAGYELAHGGRHALYVSGEVQGGSVAGEGRVVGFVALGYQLL